MFSIEKAKKIKVFIMDVDGVLTDGKVIYTKNGEEIKEFCVQDGLGIGLLKVIGIKTAVITGRKSEILEKRIKDLKIDILFQGKIKKEEAYEEIKKIFNVNDENILFIGDDVIDIPVLKKVGISVAVKNAIPEVKKICDYITKKSGGNGAVREVINLLLKYRNELDIAIERFINGKHW